MASIEFKNVVKCYSKGAKPVIPDLNLVINDKEFVILVGPSGCGKSTTLRMIAGLEEITSGDLLIGDKKVNDVAPKDRDIAMVFQSYALYPHLSVYKNMAFALKMRGESKEVINEKVMEAAKVLDLEDYLDRKPRALSGGQRQRVALGRAMVRNPKVFLLDEPLSNLDAKLRTEMRSVITKLHQTLKTTFVYVTHDQTEAMTMADRIVVMKAGVVQQYDTPQNLYEHPVNMFVAGFIGSPQMNFINVTLINTDKGLTGKFGDSEILIPNDVNKDKALNKYIGKEIVIGIRPDDFYLAETKEEAFDIHVDIAELMGSEIFIYFSFNGKKTIAKIPSSSHIKSGMDITLQINHNMMHFFDIETTDAII